MIGQRACCLVLLASLGSACESNVVSRPDSGFGADARTPAGCFSHRERLAQHNEITGPELETENLFATQFFAGYCSGCHASTRQHECDCMNPPDCTMRDPMCARNTAPGGFFCATGFVCCTDLRTDIENDPCTPPRDGRCRPTVDDMCTTSLPAATPDYNWDDMDGAVQHHLRDIRNNVVVSNYMPWQDSPFYTPPRPACSLRIRLGRWIDNQLPE